MGSRVTRGNPLLTGFSAAIIIGLTALLLLFGMARCSAVAAGGFADVSLDHPYAVAIGELSEQGVVSGYEDGSFGPDAPVTRQQFSKMIVLTMGFLVGEEDRHGFRDVPHVGPGLYPYHYVSAAANHGLVMGYDDGSFRPLDNLTRFQLVSIVVRAAAPVLQEPPDDWQGLANRADAAHGSNVRRAEFGGLLAQIESLATWDPNLPATRGEVAQLLYSLLVAADFRPPLSVLSYGAKGDGSTDDADAIQRALDARMVADRVVIIPEGTYLMGSTLDLRSDTYLTASPSTVLIGKGEVLMNLQGVRNVTLSGLTLEGSYKASGQRGIALQDVKNVHMNGLAIRNIGFAGIYSNGAASNVGISDSTITRCGDFGIHFQGGYDGVTISRVTASDFAGRLYPSHAIYMKTGTNFVVQDCDLGNAYGPGGGVSAIQIGYGASNGRILRNRVHDSPFGILVWGSTAVPTTGITCSGNVGSGNSYYDFYEYGTGLRDITWTGDNVGSSSKAYH